MAEYEGQAKEHQRLLADIRNTQKALEALQVKAAAASAKSQEMARALGIPQTIEVAYV